MVPTTVPATMKTSPLTAACAALALATSLAACGGSGSDAGSQLQVTFSQSPLQVATFDTLTGRSATVTVTVSPPPPDTAIVQVSQSGAFFDLVGVGITAQGGGTYLVDLPYADGLAAGAYTGTISFKICQDQACTVPYRLSTSTLAYSVDVAHADPQLQVTFSQAPLQVATFDTLTGRSAKVLVTVSPAPPDTAVVLVSQSGSFFDLLGIGITDQGGGAYLVDLPYPDGVAAGIYTGTISFEICQDLACTLPYRLSTSTLGYSVGVAHLTAGTAPGTVVLDPGAEAFDVNFDDTAHRRASFKFTIDPAPATKPTVLVLDGGGVLTAGPATVTEYQGSYYAFLPYPDALVAGSYTGSFTYKVCQDSACTLAYVRPRPTLDYHIVVNHVQTGLPPLTATFKVDAVASTDAVAGLNGAGERTYTLAMHDGQTVAITPGVDWTTIWQSSPSHTVTSGPLIFGNPEFGFQLHLAQGALSGTYEIDLRVADGRYIRVTVTVTP
jgi:lipoprotein-anchoring transpeptidase ErfK/SrfK